MNNPELVASLLKKGGKVLIAGGEMKDLPREYQDHPQIIIWDDNQNSIENKEVPSNVKVIIYNRWVSHKTAKRLSDAAKDLHAIKFPMLRSREIKELMSEVITTEPQDVPPEQIEKIIDENSPTDSEFNKETTLTEYATVKDFVAKFINVTLDYSVKGKMADEGRRLFEIAKKEKFKTTILSMQQATRLFVHEFKGTKKGERTVKSIASHAKPTPSASDDFAELDRLITDAIAAMKLVQEHMPKVRKETEKLRGMREKFRKLLE